MRTAFPLFLCGLALSLAAVERRYGVPQKPYGEGEWHTVLYNCSTPEIPSEELCASPARCAA